MSSQLIGLPQRGRMVAVKRIGSRIKLSSNQLILQAMALAGILWYIIFHYVPMYGLIIAFQDFNYVKGIWASPFVGLKYFIELVTDPDVPGILYNTLAIAILKLLICFPVTIIFCRPSQ